MAAGRAVKVEVSPGDGVTSLPQNPDSPLGPGAALACHPEASCPWVQRLQGQACLRGHRLSLGFSLLGDLDRLNIPGPGAARRADRLWQHTCFEAFLALPGQEAYWEFNLSPATEWAAYGFSRYREGGRVAEGIEPGITVQRAPGRLDLWAVLDLDVLDGTQGVRLGLTAVIESADGRLSHWALRHGPGRPDFHRRDTFILELPTGALA